MFDERVYLNEGDSRTNETKKVKKVRSNLSRTQIIGLAIMSSHQHWRYKCNQSLSLSRKPIIHCPFLMYAWRIKCSWCWENICRWFVWFFIWLSFILRMHTLSVERKKGKKHSNHTNRLQIPNGKISLPFHDSTIWIPQLSLAATKLQV